VDQPSRLFRHNHAPAVSNRVVIAIPTAAVYSYRCLVGHLFQRREEFLDGLASSANASVELARFQHAEAARLATAATGTAALHPATVRCLVHADAGSGGSI